MNNKRVWILGAEDPEMNAIETLLRECGERVEYASVDGGRVNPRTAYSGEYIVPAGATHLYLVECSPRLFGLVDEAGRERDAPVLWGGNATRIDHHRPGDPGDGKGPHEFFRASSLGQVIFEVARRNALPESWGEWRDDLAQSGRWVVSQVINGVRYETYVPHDLVVTAACDHCLGHAWAGRCPSVSREDVREYRARMAAQRPLDPVGVEEYHKRFDAAVAAVRKAPTVQIDDCACGQGMAWHDRGSGECYECGTPFVRVADMRARHVPELPDAACYLGTPYIASVTDRDGRKKIVLGGATTERIVNAFLRVWAPAQGLTGLYGDPVRGFAGGYED